MLKAFTHIRVTEQHKYNSNIGYTYLISSEVNDFEEIRDWAAFHQI